MIDQHPITSRQQWLALRRQDVTASAIGCLLGVHDYQTPLALWAEKTGHLADAEQTGAMERGIEMEPVAVNVIRRRCPDWAVKYPVGIYYRDPVARLGCTPDALANDPSRDGDGVIQIKSVEASTFRRKWRDPETGETVPPLWIAAQAIVEAHLTGASWACVAVIVCGHVIDLHMVDVPIHAGLIDRLKSEAAAFWRMVESRQQPPADYGRDGALLEDLYDGAGPEIDLSGSNSLMEIADERERLSAEKSAAEKRLKAIKAELLAALGEAGAGRLADGRLITAKRVPKKAYSVSASSYVDVRIKQAMERAA